jgi:HEAT repeat protein
MRVALWVNLAIAVLVVGGCAEGPFWRSGRFSPWARNRWAEEEKLADTLFERRRQMNEQVSRAKAGMPEAQQDAAKKLTEIVQRDPVLLLRLHAVSLLGQLNCPAAIEGLKYASTDPDPDVRMAAVKAWEQVSGEAAIVQLEEMIGSDTNVDVRLAATRALGSFSGERAVKALSLALLDNDPALQLRATQSLAQVTGETIGPDVKAWQSYVAQVTPEENGSVKR